MCIVICTLLLSRPARGAWVEMWAYYTNAHVPASRPARGAWVEIYIIRYEMELKYVAPRKGRVG